VYSRFGAILFFQGNDLQAEEPASLSFANDLLPNNFLAATLSVPGCARDIVPNVGDWSKGNDLFRRFVISGR
jgi:hypothetical protein